MKNVYSYSWMPLVIAIEVILVALYAIALNLNGGDPPQLLDVNGTGTLPSLLQAVQLFLLGAIPLWMYLTYSHPKIPLSRNLLGCVALLFLYASADELFKLSFAGGQHRLWKVAYLAIGLAIPILFFRDLLRLFRLYPKPMRFVIAGFATFLVGGFGLELFRTYVQEPYWYQLFGRWQFYQVDAIRTALEEFGEMLGETLVLKGMIDLTRQRQWQISLAEKRAIATNPYQ